MSAPVSAGPAALPRAGGEGRSGPAPAGSPADQPGGSRAQRGWRAWRVPLAIIAFVLAAGVVIALLQPRTAVPGYLSPDSTAPDGTHALADILGARGHSVMLVTTVPAAAAAARRGTTLVITSPFLLTARQQRRLARTQASLILVEPDPDALAVLAPPVRQDGGGPVGTLLPTCTLPAAMLAGPADLGGAGLQVRPGTPAAQCYISDGRATLIRYRSGGRFITVLSSGELLTNGSLARQGNAALAINLLSTGSRVIWLVPLVGLGPAGSSGQQPLTSLVPLTTYLVAIQLVLALVLAALWRGRRLGPLIVERLPVIVRAAETVEGHARLYQSHRARGRVAAELRAALLRRASPAIGLPAGAPPAEVTAALAARSALAEARVADLVYGAAPRSDADLITLAADLDALDREVRTL